MDRYIISSDEHYFVGRIYDLSIVEMHFDSCEDLSKIGHCKYVSDVNREISILVNRVESLNLVGGMIWLDLNSDQTFKYPVTKFEWLTIVMDVFLIRYISVLDCAVQLANEIFEVGLSRKRCSIDRRESGGVPSNALDILKKIQTDQGLLRDERNARVHHGLERSYTDDDLTFRLAAIFEQWGSSIVGTDRLGRSINLEVFFEEALNNPKNEFSETCGRLSICLDELYDNLSIEFEARLRKKLDEDI